ncbi:Sarcosine oxidase [Rubrobacter xylanophilus DSM 9941]|uniref:Sarcosine oxidase n=1 Tax=Rubrobacter xylanophilus (strain DSM 9941 / JCM 11954 / NBRC 16129 / PRD-1) TaxID=266117 RepID=Q1AVQ8_RUBXD|nr:N-methyl-L-tryptophan oxidase [Rubrobacter xylanophilus]ABG04520.1 Sarcosine oxidase [Rubrobacter xylanophilus DSM 9941]
MKSPEVVVVGCGGLGSAALYWLSRRVGSSALGIEQFRIGHERGASQDHSRIIRLAQHQSEYAALAPQAYETWHELEEQSGQRLVIKTGGLVIEASEERDPAKVGTRNVDGYVATFEEHGFDYELLEPEELISRWPQFRLKGNERIVYQKDSGIVDARKANATHVALARAQGARILEETPVRSVRPSGAGVEVVTDHETFFADRVVITADAWTNNVLEGVGLRLPLTVTQEQVTYYATPNLKDFSPERFPVFMWHGKHNFYGFPVYGEVATKLGQHMGGHEVTAETRTFEPDPVRQERYRNFLSKHIPGFLGPELYTKTCLYTIPPDQNFIIDTLPEHPQISVAIGAGHAFKFASLIGRILSELALDGSSSFPIEPFTITRPAITDKTFQRSFHA